MNVSHSEICMLCDHYYTVDEESIQVTSCNCPNPPHDREKYERALKAAEKTYWDGRRKRITVLESKRLVSKGE